MIAGAGWGRWEWRGWRSSSTRRGRTSGRSWPVGGTTATSPPVVGRDLLLPHRRLRPRLLHRSGFFPLSISFLALSMSILSLFFFASLELKRVDDALFLFNCVQSSLLDCFFCVCQINDIYFWKLIIEPLGSRRDEQCIVHTIY